MIKFAQLALLAALTQFSGTAFAQTTSKYFGITPEYIELAETNERVLIRAIEGFMQDKEVNGMKIVVRRNTTPFANPQSPSTIRFGFEVASVGSERQDGDHFAAMLLNYSPGIHVHSYHTITTQSDEPLTDAEASEFMAAWLVSGEPVKVYLRGETPADEEQTTVCRINLEQFPSVKDKPQTEWKDCATLEQIRKGRW